ncbi:MAG: P22 coat protein - protein 5 domain protein [Pyrinomonadaceae bacterium]
MSVQSFIPTVWSAALLTGLHKNLVFAQPGVVNTDYEGEITKQGDQVKINFIGKVSVFPVSRNQDIPDPEQLDTAATTLVISEANGFNFAVDDVDKVQAKGDLIERAMGEASYEVRDAADSFVAGLYTQAAAANLIGDDTSPIVLTADNAYDYVVDLGVKLDEANVPSGGRWCAVPPWVHGLLRKDKRFIERSTPMADDMIKHGIIGEVAGFGSILKSNNVRHTNNTKFKIMAGYPGAISYADQIVTVEAFRMEKRFSDAVKGLHVFGGKCVRPNGLAVLTANRS